MNYNYKLVLDASLDMKQISNYRDLYEQLFMLGSLKLRDIRGAFQSTGINSFERFIYTYSKETVIEITKLNRNGEGLTKEEALQLDVFCYGISFMYHKWIDGYYSISAREAADSLFAIMPETLKYLWFSRH